MVPCGLFDKIHGHLWSFKKLINSLKHLSDLIDKRIFHYYILEIFYRLVDSRIFTQN